jgi:hypothetical protein
MKPVASALNPTSSIGVGGMSPYQFPAMAVSTASQVQQPIMEVHVYLDRTKLAKELMPGIVQQIRTATGVKF